MSLEKPQNHCTKRIEQIVCLKIRLLPLLLMSLLSACTQPLAVSQSTQVSALPTSERLILESDWTTLAPEINERTSGPVPINRVVGPFILQRSDEESFEVVKIEGKSVLRSTLADGRRWEKHNYDRAGLIVDFDAPGGLLDPRKTYIIEWRGYLEQSLPETAELLLPFQVHGRDNAVPPLAVLIKDGYLNFRDFHDPSGKEWYPIVKTDAIVKQPTTLRLTVRSSDSNGYLKFEVNDKVVAERQGGRTKNPGDWNYTKVAEMYDYARTLVSPDSLEGRSYSMITEYVTISLLE
jgi:hypothetical protein